VPQAWPASKENHLKIIMLCFAAFALLAAPQLKAQGTYTQYDAPGAIETNINGIDAAGDISGTYVDASENEHGFLLTAGGTFTAINRPAFSQTACFGISSNGLLIVGSNDPAPNGFIYTVATGAFTDVTVPQSTYTIPMAVNNGGLVAGGTDVFGDREGFGFDGTNYSGITPNGNYPTVIEGITNTGVFVGTAVSNTYINFTYSGNKFHALTIVGVTAPEVGGVSSNGNIYAGYYASDDVLYGFSYAGGMVTAINFPSALNTLPVTVNNTGKVAGAFEDSSGHLHGFTWIPPAVKK
jgi:hypothetical protein